MIFKFGLIESRMGAAGRAGRWQRVVLAGLGKNVLGYYLAAQKLGLQVAAVADDQLGGPGREYRGVPICRVAEAAVLAADAWVISNMSPTQAPRQAAELRRRVAWPIVDLFDGPPAGARLQGGAS